MIDERTFAREVSRVFDDLLAQFGYESISTNDYSVRYDAPRSFVQVDYDPARADEISVWLGDPSNIEPPLELADALAATACNPEALDGIALMQTADAGVLRRLLQRAAELLEECGYEFLSGDDAAFSRAREERSRRAHHYTRSLTNRGTLERADVAWTNREYDLVHDLLSPIRDSLDSSHRRRLAFAEKRL